MARPLPLVIITLIVGAPIAWMWRGLVCGRVLYFEDVSAYFEPLWTAAAHAMRAGHLPAWAPGAFSGQPLLGDPQVGALYPPHWIWLVVSPIATYALSIVAHAALAAGGAYGLCRALGRSRVASATAAIALSLSAYFVLEARHEMFVVSAAWVPWLMWAIAAHAARGGRRSIAAIAIASGMAVLGGGWSMLVYAAPVVLVFATARLRVRPRRGLGVAVGLALGLGLAAVQLWPALAHARLSPRALPLADGFAGSYAWPSLRYLVTLVAPCWYGDDGRGTYRGAPDQWELCGYGVGLVGALCAIAALRGRRKETIAYAALVGLAAIAALGPHGPLWPLVRALPLVGRTRCPARALFVYTVAAPLLCAAGVDRLRALAPRRLRGWAWALPIAIAVEALVTFRATNPTVPRAEARVSAAVVAGIPPSPTPGPDGGRAIIDVHLGQAFHDGGLRWGIEVAGGYSSLPLWRYLHLLWIANHGRTYPGWPRPALAHDLSAQGLWTYGSPLVDLLNVRWALLPHDRRPDGSGWRSVAAGLDGIDLWQNDEALPRGRLLHRARRVADEGEAATAIADARFDPAHEAIVEDALALPGEADAPAPSDARMTVAQDDARSFAIDARAGGLLVVADPWDPSWTATIDGHRADVLRVDYALIGVAVPAGAREVALVRRDEPLRRGAMISLAALVACVVLASTRRRPPTS